ncbi:MAG: S10 family peptidase [Alphaproteobacteria bacterium]
MTTPFRPLASVLCLGVLLAFLARPPIVFADVAPAKTEQTDKTQEEASKEPVLRLPPAAITYHSATLDGEQIPYSAVAGAIKPRDDGGKPTAEIFYVAYNREPEDISRPITFVFNGGPGAASAYLHLGAIGPKVVETNDVGELIGPPPRVIANDSSWIDFTDLVFVDPVGTGYSRATGSKKDSDFWGVEQDTEALAEFIRLYLTQVGRTDSPVFLAGESYGGFRAATITRRLQKKSGISPNGLVLVSPALEFQLIYGEDFDPIPWALSLPSYAAVKLESDGVTTREGLRTALKDVEEYALSDYLVALASGAEQGGKAVSTRVAEITGLPLDKVEKCFGRIGLSFFIKEFDRNNRQLLSRYDGSISGPDPNPTSALPRGPDPVLDATVPLWSTAFVKYAQDELAFTTEQPYELLNGAVRGKWDFGTSPTRQGYAGVLDDIQRARASNRTLEVFIATGYTDLITPYMAPTYLVNQLPPLNSASPITIEDYAGGHMFYLRPDSRRALKLDVEAMYQRALPVPSEG